MSFQDKIIVFVEESKKDPSKILKALGVSRLFAAIILIGLGFFTGKGHMNLILNGVIGKGLIVDYSFLFLCYRQLTAYKQTRPKVVSRLVLVCCDFR